MSENGMKLLQDQLNALEDNIKGDTVPAEDVRAFVALVKQFFGGHFEQAAKDGEAFDPRLYGELGELAKFINAARHEFADVSPGMLQEEQLPEASDQLDEIVKTTEAATHKIMDSCEQLQDVNQRIRDRMMTIDPPLDPDVAMSIEDALNEGDTHVTNIYEACNFQDITGQRIQKIIKVLREIERQVFRMVIVFGLRNKGEALEEKDRTALAETETALLNGPQKTGEGLDQDDVDDILAKLL